MSIKRKRWTVALILIGTVVLLQLGASGIVRSKRVKNYLIAHLERTFGRPVEVREFTVSLLPSPQLDAAEISVGEDPLFGSEYFLRAEHLSAGLRWSGLIRGRFEFGTIKLTRPSLTLVRNLEGRWNLEQWLPPAQTTGAGAARVATTNHLRKIEVDEGRVSFMLGDDKQAFAFLEVSGSVQQSAAGRWELQLEAVPWRSGVQLQSAGTIRVRGQVAGTSARLQPAQLQIHWDQASLADIFRLARGQDTGVRGTFAVDATAESGTKTPAGIAATAGQWTFFLQARATEIHRWDLTERQDNPRVSVRMKGRWDPAGGTIKADELSVESPRSNLRATGVFSSKPYSSFAVQIDSAGIQATDLLGWYRAFQPDVAEGVRAEQYFTGAMTLSGWPLTLEAAAFSSRGGTISGSDLLGTIRIGPVRGGMQKNRFVLEPVILSLGGSEGRRLSPAPKAKTTASASALEVSGLHDFEARTGAITIGAHAARAEDVLKISAAFGKALNRGWELAGEGSGTLSWTWGGPLGRGWDGDIGFSAATLQVAGLNQPLVLDDVHLGLRDGRKFARIAKAEGFGGAWDGTISSSDTLEQQDGIQWHVNLHADRLDASELDRWVGPRARPGWVQRLMSSLLGSAQPSVSASELLRRVSARGALRVDEFAIEKLKFKQLHAEGDLKNLHLVLRQADAQWAGGNLHAKVLAEFSPQPHYELIAQLDRVSLAQIPFAGKLADRLGGTSSGTVQLKTSGVGREVLLQGLAGEGSVRLEAVEFRGWDIAASLASGAPHPGASHWSVGEGQFRITGRNLELSQLKLTAQREQIVLKGTVNFARQADLTLEGLTNASAKRGLAPSANHLMTIAGPLDGPKVSLVGRVAQQPGD